LSSVDPNLSFSRSRSEVAEFWGLLKGLGDARACAVNYNSWWRGACQPPTHLPILRQSYTRINQERRKAIRRMLPTVGCFS